MSDHISKHDKDCCGCMLCKHICPVGAINEIIGNDGARYPLIDKSKCISCGKCEKICAYDEKQNLSLIEAYAARRTDSVELKKSQSGGVFAAVAEYIWSLNGVVYGCTIDDKLNIKHIRVSDPSDKLKLYGSKYVQSDIDGVFDAINRDLKADKYVLFCGTSCQVAAVKKSANFASKLITMDILCHGVPGKELFDLYIKSIERHKGVVEEFKFRDKAVYGWKGAGESIKINGRWIHQDMYMTLYNTELFFRESCYSCPFKSLNHPGDITIGDLWGVEHVAPEYNDNKGISLVLINTEKGKQMLNNVGEVIEMKRVDMSMCMQDVLRQPVRRPRFKDAFWSVKAVAPFLSMKSAVFVRKLLYKLHL